MPLFRENLPHLAHGQKFATTYLNRFTLQKYKIWHQCLLKKRYQLKPGKVPLPPFGRIYPHWVHRPKFPTWVYITNNIKAECKLVKKYMYQLTHPSTPPPPPFFYRRRQVPIYFKGGMITHWLTYNNEFTSKCGDASPWRCLRPSPPYPLALIWKPYADAWFWHNCVWIMSHSPSF